MSTLISEGMAFIQNDFKSWGFDAMYIRQLVEADHQQSQRLVSVAVQATIKRIARHIQKDLLGLSSIFDKVEH